MDDQIWPKLDASAPPPPYAHVTAVSHGATNELQRMVCRAFEDAMAERTRLSKEAFLVQGFSGRKFRMFMNNLVSDVRDPRYMEIGLFHGASFCPAIYRNSVRALGIDNWSEYGGQSANFFANLAKFKSDAANTTVLDQDFRTVDYTGIGSFNILFYDGSHAEKDQYDGIMLPQPALDHTSILIVDDWNWDHVRRGTLNALTAAKSTVDYSIEVRTSFNDVGLPLVNGPRSEWHNGCFVAVVTKAET